MASKIHTLIQEQLKVDLRRTVFDKKPTRLDFGTERLRRSTIRSLNEIPGKTGKGNYFPHTEHFSLEEVGQVQEAFDKSVSEIRSLLSSSRNVSGTVIASGKDRVVLLVPEKDNAVVITIVRRIKKIIEKNIDKRTTTGKKFQRADIGHTLGSFTGGLSAAKNALDLVEDLSSGGAIDSKIAAALKKDIIKIAKGINLTTELLEDEEGAQIKATIHDRTANRQQATYEATVKNQLIEEYTKLLIININKRFSAAQIETIINARNSPSLKDRLGNVVENAFLGKKPYKYNKSTKDKDKPATKGTPKVKVKTKSKTFRLRTATGRFTNLLNVKALINTALHDQVQFNMGKGKSKQTLNYRTGRFARSVEATNLVQTRADRIEVYYTWQHDPYDVFLPGQSRLATPGRDPRKIIGRAIRQLAIKLLKNDIKFNPIPDNRS